jgi:isochorismate hydrolase
MCVRQILKSFAVVLLIGSAVSLSSQAVAQTARMPGRPASVLPTGGGQALLDPSDAVLLLLDHQTGLFQTVKDIPVADLRANTVMLAKLATLFNIPIITTASEPNGPNGPPG